MYYTLCTLAIMACVLAIWANGQEIPRIAVPLILLLCFVPIVNIAMFLFGFVMIILGYMDRLDGDDLSSIERYLFSPVRKKVVREDPFNRRNG